MSTKVKRYGWKLDGDERQTLEFATRQIRDASRLEGDWTKYTVTRTVRAKGRPLWWAIRQLQEGRAVVSGRGVLWLPEHLPQLLQHHEALTATGFQSWMLAEVQP